MNLDTLFLAIAAIIGIFTFRRGKSDVWRENYEGVKAQNAEQQLEITRLKTRVTELESKPDVDTLFKMLVEHEKRAAENNKKVLKALDAIATKLVQ